MTVGSLLTELRRLDVRIWVEGDQLRCNAPAGVLTPDLRDTLRRSKEDMIRFLRTAESVAHQQRAIVPLQPHGTRAPIFAVPGHNGDVFLYRALAAALGDDQPFFGLEPPGLADGTQPLGTVEDLAAYFAQQIREFRPDGPYAIAGYCAGATIAYEIAQQLAASGARIAYVAMFAAGFPPSYRPLPQLRERVALRFRRARKHVLAVTTQSLSHTRAYIRERLQNIAAVRSTPDPILALRARLMRITAGAVARYQPRAFDGHVALVFPSRGCVPQKSMLRWHDVTPHIADQFGPDGCEGDVMLLDPYAKAFAGIVRGCADRS